MRMAGMWLAAGWLTATTALAVEPAAARALRHDPFSRSMIQQFVQKTSIEDPRQIELRRPADGSPAPQAAATSAAAPASPPPAPIAAMQPLPVLRALLRSGSRPMANVDGRLLEIGESVDGLRLVEIGEYSAVFMKGRRRIELALGGATAP